MWFKESNVLYRSTLIHILRGPSSKRYLFRLRSSVKSTQMPCWIQSLIRSITCRVNHLLGRSLFRSVAIVVGGEQWHRPQDCTKGNELEGGRGRPRLNPFDAQVNLFKEGLGSKSSLQNIYLFSTRILPYYTRRDKGGSLSYNY